MGPSVYRAGLANADAQLYHVQAAGNRGQTVSGLAADISPRRAGRSDPPLRPARKRSGAACSSQERGSGPL